MSDLRMAALLSTMAATPEVYIEVNHYTSIHKNPNLGLSRDLSHDKSGTPNPQQFIDRSNKPPQQVCLHISWDESVNFQCMCNSQLSDYGQLTIDDQDIWFDGHNPIDSMHKQFEQAHGELSDPDSKGDEDEEPNNTPNCCDTPPHQQPPNAPPLCNHSGGGGGGSGGDDNRGEKEPFSDPEQRTPSECNSN
jgi:hypothetical protein